MYNKKKFIATDDLETHGTSPLVTTVPLQSPTINIQPSSSQSSSSIQSSSTTPAETTILGLSRAFSDGDVRNSSDNDSISNVNINTTTTTTSNTSNTTNSTNSTTTTTTIS